MNASVKFNPGRLLVLYLLLLSDTADMGVAICVVRSLCFYPKDAVYINASFATALKFLSSTAAPETDFQKQKEKHAELSGMKLMCVSCLSCSTFMCK